MTDRTVYSTDDDLLEIRPNILSLGVSDWEEKHKEAFKIINRTLITRWYKSVAPEMGVDYTETTFDPDYVDITQVKRLACYKTLELAYIYLMKDAPNSDGFERGSKTFRDLYITELTEVLSQGVDYDWDLDDTVEDTENYKTPMRRLHRC